MNLLGAILAGGASRRFGSDKAMALYRGKPLLDHVADALRPQCGAIVVAGRTWPGIATVADIPEPGLGPLGGLAGALRHARLTGFDAVLSCGCDIIGLPENLADRLESAPAIFDELPVIGLWPVGLAEDLERWLASPANRSVYRYADHAGAQRMRTPAGMINANRPGDLG